MEALLIYADPTEPFDPWEQDESLLAGILSGDIQPESYL